ncbi:hypothetical protein FA15DRAFT_603070, partial [Coprinopsis marcescibilis]
NWLPWKRRMTAVLPELQLDEYITGLKKKRPVKATANMEAGIPAVTDSDIAAWEAGKSKARTCIELAIGDTEMFHIFGAETAGEIWDRLSCTGFQGI